MASLGRRLLNAIFKQDSRYNSFNDAFIGSYGGGYTPYDTDAETYIEEGYNINPLVYSIINQMSVKSANVPFYIKEVEDEQAKMKLDMLYNSTKGDLSIQQHIKYSKLLSKAFSKEDKPFPLERPNVSQTWTEFIALYKTFLKTTGNVYIYTLSPEEGVNAGTPLQVYLLPSHLMQIVVKDNVSMIGIEDPVRAYLLTYGRGFIEFKNEDVIHIKYSNPNYGETGEHLYGLSPLQAALKNIQSSNQALDLNIKTLKSGGAFGLIHAKNTPLTEVQAKSIKDRLLEMDSNPEQLSKIAGVSAEVGFTRLSLTSDELKPFDYLGFDRQQVADCLIWEIVDGSRGDFGGNNTTNKKTKNNRQYTTRFKTIKRCFK